MVTNIGDAEIDGISVDFAAYLWDSLDFGLNLQILDPRVTEGNDLVGTRTGDRLPFSAEEKGAVWVEYTFPGEVAGGHVYSRFQWTYTGNMLNGVSQPRTLQPAYQISDFKVGFEVRGLGDLRLRRQPDQRARHPLRPGGLAARDDLDQLAAHLGPRVLEELGRHLTTARRGGAFKGDRTPAP